MLRIMGLAFLAAVSGFGQFTQDNSAAGRTIPWKVSDVETGTCTVSEVYYNRLTGVLRICRTANTWTDAATATGTGGGGGITSLTGDVTGSGSGAVAATTARLGGSGGWLIPTQAQMAGIEQLTATTASLTGWTVVGGVDAGWSIVGGAIHHAAGSASRLAADITLVADQQYVFNWTADSQSGTRSYLNLGADCAVDCGYYSALGSNIYITSAPGSGGASVVEIVAEADSVFTLSAVSLKSYTGNFYRTVSDSSRTVFGAGAGAGTRSVAVGIYALHSATTGRTNTAIGLGALQNLTTGSYNIAIGETPLAFNVSGSRNIALGTYSLSSSLTASDNIGVGHQVMYFNETGIANIAMGSNSLFSQTAGDGNVALGYTSMNSSTTGQYNTALGYSSLYGSTTGSNNIAIGAHSAKGATVSSNQIQIVANSSDSDIMRGSQKDANSSVLIGPVSTTGTNSNSGTALENIVAINGVATASNQTVIGNSSTAEVFVPGIATGSAGTKKVLCYDTATKQIWYSSTSTDCSN